MERVLKKYDKESMKMTILKHEETFREQVNLFVCLFDCFEVLVTEFVCLHVCKFFFAGS